MKKRVCAFALSFALCAGMLSGCGTKASDASSASADSASSAASEASAVSGTDNTATTVEEAQKAIELVQSSLIAAANDDAAAFKDCFDESYTEEEINGLFKSIQDNVKNGYTKYIVDHIVNSDGNYGVQTILYYLGDEEDGERDFKEVSSLKVVKVSGGTAKITCETAAVNAVSDAIADKYPEEYVKVSEAGGNYADFTNTLKDWTWINKSGVIEGITFTMPYLIWQNDDGSVSVLVYQRNGTDGTEAASTRTLTATDENIGSIFTYEFTSQELTAGKGEAYIVTVPADKVETGDKEWQYVSVYVN